MVLTHDWSRSSFCDNVNCVEVAWVSASPCSGGQCVQVGRDGDQILVRDSKNAAQQPLAFSRGEWDEFLAGVEAGQFRDL